MNSTFTGFIVDTLYFIEEIFFGVIWFVLFLAFVHTCFFSQNNPVGQSIQSLGMNSILIRCGIVACLYIAIIVFLRYKQKAFEKKVLKEYESSLRKDKPDYYDLHPESMPKHCLACGGPYPDCKASCNLYDD